MPPGASPMSGPTGTRPREGLRPTSPHQPAGRRIEPAPSLACAAASARDATSAAEPPLDPPALRSGAHGFRVDPLTTGEVSGLNLNSDVAVLTRLTRPARRNRRVSS